MILFLVGIAILILGYVFYSKFVVSLFGPDDRQTPAYRLEDGVDYVPMNITQNSLVQLLNIAGTGPIFGPIAGILWGPIVFLIIPIGNIFAGSVHDYLAGMLCVRENGAQAPTIVKKYLGNGTFQVFNILLLVLLILIGAVFVTIPGNIILYDFFDMSSVTAAEFFKAPAIYVFGAIFIYYVIATLLPIDKVIGKVYPLFGAALIIGSLGVFIALFTQDGWLEALNSFCAIENISFDGHPSGLPLIPLFFTTVACGIVSGFHSSQSPLIAKTLKHEKEGRVVFYGMMVLEGVIAMIWAAGGMIAVNVLGVQGDSTAKVVAVAHAALPGILGTIAVVSLIILPLTSGDTALRGARLAIAEYIKFDQKPIKNRLIVAVPLFIVTFALVIWSKVDAAGFDALWRYFAWANQTVAVFILFSISAYLYVKFKGSKNYLVSLIPAIFYCFIVISYFIGGNATRESAAMKGEPAVVNVSKEIGLMMGYSDNAFITYGGAAALTVLITYLFFKRCKTISNDKDFEVS